MKSRYLILLSLILTIGLAGLSGLTTGCTGLLDDPGQMTIDRPPGAVENPNEQAEQKDAMYLSDLKCPVTEERDLAEFLKYMPKECGEMVLISDLTTILKDVSILNFINGSIERGMTEDQMKELIRNDSKYNQGRFPNGMNESEVQMTFDALTDDMKSLLQDEARENVNINNDDMYSFFLGLLDAQTDVVMCAKIDGEETSMPNSKGSDGGTPNLANDVGLGLRGMIGMKVAESERQFSDEQNNTRDEMSDGDDGAPLVVIITASKIDTAPFLDKLANKKEFKEMSENQVRRLQKYTEEVKARASALNCQSMNTDGEFFCEGSKELADGKRLFTIGKVERLSKLSDMQQQKNAETLFSNIKLRQMIDRSSSPNFRLGIYLENPTPDAFSGLPNSAGVVSGINLKNRCAEMSVLIDDERSFDMIMTLPKIDIGSLLRLIPISLSGDDESRSTGNSNSMDNGSRYCEPTEQGMANDYEYPASESDWPGEQVEEMPPEPEDVDE